VRDKRRLAGGAFPISTLGGLSCEAYKRVGKSHMDQGGLVGLSIGLGRGRGLPIARYVLFFLVIVIRCLEVKFCTAFRALILNFFDFDLNSKYRFLLTLPLSSSTYCLSCAAALR
jgi:hypothetical protein